MPIGVNKVSRNSQISSTIPDNGIYLDGFTDNKLSNRDAYTTTALSPESLEPDSSAYSDPSRPEWSVGSGNPTVTSERLELNNGEYVYAPLSEVDVTIEYDFTYVGSLSVRQYDTILATGTSQRSGEFNLEEGYYFDISPSTVGLHRGSDFSELTSGSYNFQVGQPATIRLENDYDSGSDTHNFELFVDGTSFGTASDSTYSASEIAYTSFVVRDSGSGDTTLRDNFRVF